MRSTQNLIIGIAAGVIISRVMENPAFLYAIAESTKKKSKPRKKKKKVKK